MIGVVKLRVGFHVNTTVRLFDQQWFGPAWKTEWSKMLLLTAYYLLPQPELEYCTEHVRKLQFSCSLECEETKSFQTIIEKSNNQGG